MAFLGKEFKLVKQENFEEFLRSSGAPADVVTKQAEFKPTLKVVKNGDGDNYTVYTTTPEGPKVIDFKSGVEFEEKFQGKVPIRLTLTVEGNTITQVTRSDTGDSIFKWDINGDELVMTITAANFDGVAKRWYKA